MEETCDPPFFRFLTLVGMSLTSLHAAEGVSHFSTKSLKPSEWMKLLPDCPTSASPKRPRCPFFDGWKIFEVRTTVTGDLKDLKRAWDVGCRLSKYLERTLNGRMEMISWRNSWESVNFGMWLLTLKRLGPKPLIDWWKNPRFFVLGQLVSGNFWDPQQRVEDSDFMWLCFNKISMVFLYSKQVSNSKSPAFLRSLIEKSINRPRHVRSFRWKRKKIQNCPGILTPWWQHSGTVPQGQASPVFTPVPTAKLTGNPGIFTWHIRQRSQNPDRIFASCNPCRVAPKPCKGQPGNPKKAPSSWCQLCKSGKSLGCQCDSLLQNIISHEIQSIGVTSSLSKLKWYRPILDRSWHKETHPFCTLPQVVYSWSTFNLANSWDVIEFSFLPLSC